jgi:hypothetical protein
MFDDRNACCLARIYIKVYSIREIRLESSRKAASVSVARARFSGENTLTSSSCNMYDICGGRIRRLIIYYIQYAITFAVI